MDKVLGMLGIAKKAGKVVTGTFLCEKSIKTKKSALVIIAEDVSEASKKNITDACAYYSVEYMEYSNKRALGKITGGGDRVVVSVEDAGFAKAIMKSAGILR